LRRALELFYGEERTCVPIVLIEMKKKMSVEDEFQERERYFDSVKVKGTLYLLLQKCQKYTKFRLTVDTSSFLSVSALPNPAPKCGSLLVVCEMFEQKKYSHFYLEQSFFLSRFKRKLCSK